MTNLKNVEVIVDKMMNYLKHTTLESVSKKDILTKITELTERFAPSKSWFIKVMNELFVNFGDMITDDILSKLIKIITEKLLLNGKEKLMILKNLRNLLLKIMLLL